MRVSIKPGAIQETQKFSARHFYQTVALVMLMSLMS